MVKRSTIALVTLICGSIFTVDGLKCYSCSEENHNGGTPCTKTVVTCDAYQDTCAVHVSFHAKERYSRAERIHHITKGCDTAQACFYRGRITNENCVRSSTRDWSCLDCCTGDLCNYHVKLGSSRSTMVNVFALIASLFVSIQLISG